MASAAAPTLRPLASLARGALSGSVTRARQATGTHLHRILGYSHVQGSVPTGDYIMSKPFVIGGRKWRLHIYPNGVNADHRGFISADLSLAYGEEATMATYRVSVLDDAGNPVHSRIMGSCGFNLYGSERTGIIRDLVATEELQRSAPFLLRNDCLNIQCDVATVKMETKRRKMWWFI